jgi:CubicO group peptidase (beta-lactamase class C family)
MKHQIITRLFIHTLLPVFLTACGLTNSAATPTVPIPTATTPPTLTAVPTQTATQPPTPTPTFPVEQRGKVQQWSTSTPEEHGMDSARLATMLRVIQKDGRNIHSILVARNGVLVLEVYFPPFDRETPHNLYSCTKSVTSTAVGLALRDNLIASIDTPASSFFPDVTLDDEGKQAITLKHLLTMSSGLEWSEPLRSGLSDNWALTDSNSPADYFFNRPVAAQPGEMFNYNTGGSHLLSMIVADAAGVAAVDYVERALLAPLGIDRYMWQKDSTGHTLGGSGLALAPADLLRYGQLYLQRGVWEGEQILPEEWVDESTRPHITTQNGVDYGYQWWVRPNGIYNALGWGGQQVIVLPKQDMVVVFTAGIRDASWSTFDDLLTGYLIPAVRSNSSLAPNPTAVSSLKEQIEIISLPAAKAPGVLSPLANEVSGKTYVDLNGSHGWSTFTFTFDRPDEAVLELMYGDKSEQITALVGMDDIYRVTETLNYGPIALKGYWKDASTFVLTQQFLREAERITMEMTFTGDEVKRVSQWTVEDHSEESDAVLLNR